MIKFSWKKINDKLDWDPISVIQYFYMMQRIKRPGYLPKKIPHKVKIATTYIYPSGPCFIINPNKVLNKAKMPDDLYLYLELASKRDIFDYLIRGVKHLPLVLTEEYNIKRIESNPMMKIKNDNVYFKYEQEKKQYVY